MLFGDIGQSVVGKQVGAVLKSSRGTDQIPPEIAQIVCTKYTWRISITEKSFRGPKKTFQVNRVITAFGRQTVIPQLYHSVHTAASDSRTTNYIEGSPFEKSLAPEILQHTPPAATRLCITEGKEKQDLQATHNTTKSAKKRLYDVATALDQNINIQNTGPTEEHTSHDITDDKINPAAGKKLKICRSTHGSSTD